MKSPLAIVALFVLVGCVQRDNIRTYPYMSVADSLRVMQERSAKIKDISGEGAITLTDSRGQSVRLDSAFAFAPPDRARVRAWKFGQAVLDLTVAPDATFLFLPRKDAHADQLRSASADTSRAVREWLKLLSRGFDQSNDVRESGSQLIVRNAGALSNAASAHTPRRITRKVNTPSDAAANVARAATRGISANGIPATTAGRG